MNELSPLILQVRKLRLRRPYELSKLHDNSQHLSRAQGFSQLHHFHHVKATITSCLECYRNLLSPIFTLPPNHPPSLQRPLHTAACGCIYSRRQTMSLLCSETFNVFLFPHVKANPQPQCRRAIHFQLHISSVTAPSPSTWGLFPCSSLCQQTLPPDVHMTHPSPSGVFSNITLPEVASLTILYKQHHPTSCLSLYWLLNYFYYY